MPVLLKHFGETALVGISDFVCNLQDRKICIRQKTCSLFHTKRSKIIRYAVPVHFPEIIFQAGLTDPELIGNFFYRNMNAKVFDEDAEGFFCNPALLGGDVMWCDGYDTIVILQRVKKLDNLAADLPEVDRSG